MPAVMVNGKPHELSTATTLSALIRELRQDPARLLVEVNGQVIPAAQFDRVELHDGDRIELLAFVGGG